MKVTRSLGTFLYKKTTPRFQVLFSSRDIEILDLLLQKLVETIFLHQWLVSTKHKTNWLEQNIYFPDIELCFRLEYTVEKNTWANQHNLQWLTSSISHLGKSFFFLFYMYDLL